MSKASAVYSMGPLALARCTLNQYNSPWPRYMSCTQSTLSSSVPVEIVFFLLCHLNLVTQNSTWIMVATHQPHFAAALCVQGMFPVDMAVAYLCEEKVVPKAFVTNLMAGVLKCDRVAPISPDTACNVLEDGFPMDCSGTRYVEQEEEAP